MTGWLNMSTSETKKRRKLFVWFKFYPSDWINVLTMPDKQCAECFKNLVSRLMKNEAPEGSKEAEMIGESENYSKQRREAVMKRWQSNKPIQLPRNKAEVIAFAEDNGLDVDAALEWAEINLKERKGNDKNGEPIHNWKKACAGYCESLKNKN